MALDIKITPDSDNYNSHPIPVLSVQMWDNTRVILKISGSIEKDRELVIRISELRAALDAAVGR